MKKDFDNGDGGPGEGVGGHSTPIRDAYKGARKGGVANLSDVLHSYLAKLAAPPSSFGRNVAVEKLAKAIQRAVGDPLLELTPCLRVARAIEEGDYPESS